LLAEAFLGLGCYIFMYAPPFLAIHREFELLALDMSAPSGLKGLQIKVGAQAWAAQPLVSCLGDCSKVR
jgi:hypothetical protein